MVYKRPRKGGFSHSVSNWQPDHQMEKMANIVRSIISVIAILVASGQARSISTRQLDSLGGNQLLGRAVLDLQPQDFQTSYTQEKDFARSLDTLGGGNILRSRSLDTLGGGSILRSRSLDTLGGGSILRSRSPGSIESPARMGEERYQGYYPPLDTLGGGNLF